MPFVYIMTNRSKTFYTGTARDLRSRVWQHKNGWFEDSFTDRYHLDRLVFYEQCVTYAGAISREKQIKGDDAAEEDGADCCHESHLGRPERRLVRRA